MTELSTAIDSVEKGKSAGNKGIKAEDLKRANEETTNMTQEGFNLIIRQNTMTPSLWKKNYGLCDL